MSGPNWIDQRPWIILKGRSCVSIFNNVLKQPWWSSCRPFETFESSYSRLTFDFSMENILVKLPAPVRGRADSFPPLLPQEWRPEEPWQPHSVLRTNNYTKAQIFYIVSYVRMYPYRNICKQAWMGAFLIAHDRQKPHMAYTTLSDNNSENNTWWWIKIQDMKYGITTKYGI
jgi:hypothetical protein